jgi:S1-C subfamily serine protease
VKDLEKEEVTLVARGAKALQARVVRYDENSDVALLKSAPLPGAPCLKLATDKAKAGEEVYVVGAPAGEELSFSMSRGIISGRRNLYGSEYLQTDASINPGNSGGPLLDGSAEVLGIVSWKLAGRALEGLGFAVEIHSALRSLSLELGGEATDSLAKERAATNVVAEGVEDQADEAWQVIGAPDPGGTKSRVSPIVVNTLRAGGWLAVLTGGAVLIVSAVANENGNLNGWVTAGAVVTGVGAAAVITSWILQPFSRSIGLQTSKQGGFEFAGGRAQLLPVVAPTGVGLNVSYALR